MPKNMSRAMHKVSCSGLSSTCTSIVAAGFLGLVVISAASLAELPSLGEGGVNIS